MEDRKDGNMQSDDRAWTFGAKVMHDTGEWSRQLVTFTCNNDLETSTIPPSENDTALRSKKSWAEMLGYHREDFIRSDAAYDECVKNAFRDAHLLESPGSMWKLSHSHFSAEHVDLPNTVLEQYGLYLPKLCQPDLGLGQLEGRGWDPDYKYLKWDMDACGFNDNTSMRR